LKKKLENEVAPLGGVGKWELALFWSGKLLDMDMDMDMDIDRKVI